MRSRAKARQLSIEAELTDRVELSLPALRAAAELALEPDDPLNLALATVARDASPAAVETVMQIAAATAARRGGDWRRVSIAYGGERMRQFAVLARPPRLCR